MRCAECGELNEESRQFCDRCGAKLTPLKLDPKWLRFQETVEGAPKPEHQASPHPATPSPLPSDAGNKMISRADVLGDIFHSGRIYYVMPRDLSRLGIVEIWDEQGRRLGKITKYILSIRRRYEFESLSGTILATVTHKVMGIPPGYEVSDSFGSVIARIPKPLISWFSPKYILYNGNNQPELVATGGFRDATYDIAYVSNPQMPVALIRSAQYTREWLQFIPPRVESYQILKVIDPKVDRLKLLALMLTIHDILHL